MSALSAETLRVRALWLRQFARHCIDARLAKERMTCYVEQGLPSSYLAAAKMRRWSSGRARDFAASLHQDSAR